MTVAIQAKTREQTGKQNTRKVRRLGMTPGVFYYHGTETFHLLFDSKELQHFLTHAHGLVELRIEGQKDPLKCVLKEVQYDPVSEEILHVDFQGVKMGEKITVTVPVVLEGTPEGVKTGGILEHMIREVEIECFPRHLPESLEVDVSSLKIGDVLHIKDLSFENIHILDDPNEALVVIEAPRAAVEMEAEELEEGLEEITEPEVISGKKEEEQEEEKKTEA